MASKAGSGAAAVETFFAVLERLVLFLLSVSVGLLNLLIGIVVAARLGVIPKAQAGRVLRAADRAEAIVGRVMGSAPRALPKRKGKP